ncbi:receptor L domain protein, partial [Ancylostoma duodenale]
MFGKKLLKTNINRLFDACSDRRTESEHCRIIEGILVLGDPRNRNLPNLEEVYGSVILSRSELERLPHMPKLKKIQYEEHFESPVITIVDNPNLKSIAELAKVEDIVLGSWEPSVVIRNNSKLCIEPEIMQTSFVNKYASHIMECGSKGGSRDPNSENSPPDA